VNGFDVSVHAIRRRPGRRKPFEVRWRAAGRSKSKSFITRKLADSYRAELVRAARMGLDFDPLTGEPTAWNLPEPAIVTWYEEATAYAEMKWPSLAAHSRASLAEALATVTPALTRPGGRDRPGSRELRTALYQHAFNPARPAEPGSAAAQVLDWAQQASLPVGRLSEPAVLRTALEALTFRLCRALDPAVVASPGQASALLDTVARTRPELTAFFGCLYYAALRPEEAVALRYADCHLPGSGWGMLRLAAAAPRTAAAWTSNGTSHEQRGLKHRPDGAIRMVPAPPVLVAMLRAHFIAYGTAPDGRLFRGTRGGPLSESGLRPYLARRPQPRPRARASRQRPRATPLRPAPRPPVAVAEQRWHPRPRQHPQPADRPGTQALRRAWSVPVRGKPAVYRPRDCTETSGTPTTPAAGRRPPCGRGYRPLCARNFPARPADGPQITSAAGHRSSLSINVCPVQSQLLERRLAIWPGPQLAHRRSANRSPRHAKAGAIIR
jgi:integrase